jgi:hypothetical protein
MVTIKNNIISGDYKIIDKITKSVRENNIKYDYDSNKSRYWSELTIADKNTNIQLDIYDKNDINVNKQISLSIIKRKNDKITILSFYIDINNNDINIKSISYIK